VETDQVEDLPTEIPGPTALFVGVRLLDMGVRVEMAAVHYLGISIQHHRCLQGFCDAFDLLA
jgi:hypothetical protein